MISPREPTSIWGNKQEGSGVRPATTGKLSCPEPLLTEKKRVRWFFQHIFNRTVSNIEIKSHILTLSVETSRGPAHFLLFWSIPNWGVYIQTNLTFLLKKKSQPWNQTIPAVTVQVDSNSDGQWRHLMVGGIEKLLLQIVLMEAIPYSTLWEMRFKLLIALTRGLNL